MGDIAEMMLDGTLCEGCGVALDGAGEGFPRRCCDCQEESTFDQPKKASKCYCPDGGRLSPLYAAAPELLEALDSVLQSLQTGVPETIGYGEQTKKAFSEGWNAALNAVYERAADARAALAKARGEA